MRRLFALMLAFGVVVAFGCEQKTGTAPSTNPNQTGEARKLTITVAGDHTITQGKTDDVLVNVMRDNFKGPVTLEVTGLPTGVTLQSGDLTVPADQNNITIVLKAADDAQPVEDHVFTIRGKSNDIMSEPLKVELTVKAK